MSLTSQDLEKKTFSSTRLRSGYDPEEVDDYLDRIGKTLDLLYRSLAEEQERVHTMQREKNVGWLTDQAEAAAEREEAETTRNQALRVLESAERVASQILAQAHADAEQYRIDAEGLISAEQDTYREQLRQDIRQLTEQKEGLEEEVRYQRARLANIRDDLNGILEGEAADESE